MDFGQGNVLVNSVNSISGKELKITFHEVGLIYRSIYLYFYILTLMQYKQLFAWAVYRNSTGDVIGFGGYFYEQLVWISLYLNFR